MIDNIEKINVISWYSIDIVNYLQYSKTIIKKGWPLYFFEQYIKNKHLELKLNKLVVGFCVVEIDRDKEEEYGTISFMKQIISSTLNNLYFDNMLISFIKDEIDYLKLKYYKVNNLFIDLQGYFRSLSW